MASERDIDESKSIIYAFWRHLQDANWEKLAAMLAEEFEAFWPQYDEEVSDADSFIDLCRINPHELKIQVLNCVGEYDR